MGHEVAGRSRPTCSARCRARPIPRSGWRLRAPARSARMLEEFAPDAIHLATEGPLCLAARRWCLRARLALHHRLSHAISRLCRGAHRAAGANGSGATSAGSTRPAQAILASTAVDRGDAGGAWPDAGARRGAAGVDLAQFPARTWRRIRRSRGLPGPIQLYVGRVAVEKNIEAFLDRRHPGTKVVVGDGPARAALERRYPRRAFPRPAVRRGARRGLCRGRRVRLSQPHRHVRAGDDRGAGLRHAGRGLSGDRADRRARRPRRARWTRISTPRSPTR